MTAIDKAHSAMEAEPSNETVRLAFYERLMEAELFLMLAQEPTDTSATPEIFAAEGQDFALIFDREERLAAFAEKPVPYVGLSGRNIVQMLAGRNIGLGLNLAVASSSILLPADAVEWMASMITSAAETTATPESVAPPTSVPEQIVVALDLKLAAMAGLADTAYLADITYDNQTRNAALAFVNAAPDAQTAIANAISEAITFSGIEAAALDVLFLRASDPICAKLATQGLRFDLPEVIAPTAPDAPGMNPAKPPKLH
ncbi:hypothetical protein GCM10007939_25380 [Amylibacter marinus]|uniref:SseB protein N-terminal domain-containing protein n=1 Tax=Amylibacter marinus TaxID=1475483 RepID=A0ABQ5VYI3_9RHOB|nr:SseB family protein [Amylibacter marinus]GLQ36254.1 hypothetical protein GCM10007939_25380 [Amylibacter marinus]